MSMVQSISGVAFGPQQLDQPALLVVDMQNDFVRLFKARARGTDGVSVLASLDREVVVIPGISEDVANGVVEKWLPSTERWV